MEYGSQFVELALSHEGEAYNDKYKAPLHNRFYHGPWDCAEFVTYIVYQVTGMIYGRNRGDDSYTGYWRADAENRKVQMIPWEQAAEIYGAILLRYPGVHSEKPRGHIAFSLGDGKTIEAMDSRNGVKKGDAYRGYREAKINHRLWNCGILIPGVNYDNRLF